MSTRDKLFTMLDTLEDSQLEGLYQFLKNFIPISETPNEETLEAVKEVEEMRRHPENYRSYDSFEEMVSDIL